MIIKTRLTEKDFIRAFFTIIYNKPIIKVFIGIAVFYTAILTIQLAGGAGKALPDFFVPVFVLIAFPCIFYFTAKKNYASNKRISEPVEYRFDKDLLVIKGESFTAELTWDKIHKVSQTKKLLLIWQTPQLVNIIPKRDIWEGDILALKEILNHHRVKNNL